MKPASQSSDRDLIMLLNQVAHQMRTQFDQLRAIWNDARSMVVLSHISSRTWA